MVKYKCKDEIMIRVPYNSIEFYKRNLLNYKEDDYVNYCKNNYMESIATSSMSLYENICENNGSKYKISSAVLKYLIRSSMRSTPYGLNSGVINCRFSNKNNLIINNEFKKKVRPDMEWLIKIIKKCEEIIGEKLIIISNNSYDSNLYKIHKKWNSAFCKENKTIDKKIYINNTALIQRILSLTKNYISIEDLLSSLNEVYPNKDKEIKKIVKVLLDNEFLTSNLRETLIFENQFDILLNKLKSYKIENELIDNLIELQQLLCFYENISISDGIEEYVHIIEFMSGIIESNSYIQIDMYQDKLLEIDSKMKKDIEDLADVLIQLSYFESYEEYAMKFLDKYGNQGVKFLDVIDENTGIGIPYFDQNKSIEYNDNFMCMMFNLASKSSKKIIKLDNDLKMKNESTNDKYFQDIEIVLQIFEEDGQIKYAFPPLFGTNYGGKILGRFKYLFKDQFNKKSNSIVKKVELSFIPQYGRHANVMLCHTDADYVLEYGVHSENKDYRSIDLSDIYMYIDKNNQIKFIYGKTMEELEFVISNMYNLDGLPHELRILYDLTEKQKCSITSFPASIYHLVNKMNNHCPRIEYKNIIIMPECWKLDKNIFKKNNKLVDFTEFRLLYEKYKEKYNIPSVISAGPMDQKLVLNTKNSMHLKLLYDLILHDNDTILFEHFFIQNESLIKNGFGENFSNEVIFELIKKEKHKEKQHIYDISIPLIEQNAIKETKELPFKNWISLKLYFDKIHQDACLSKILEWINKNFDKNIINYFFYLRYEDPSPHLRLRFNVNNISNIIYIKQMIEYFDNQNILNDCVIDTYFPEIERYGGIECIHYAEVLFSADSYFSIHILRLINTHSISFNKIEAYFISILHMIKELHLSLDDVVIFLDDYRLDKRLKDNYNNFLQNLNEILCFDENILDLNKSERGIQFLSESQLRMPEYKNYWNILENKYDLESKWRIKYAFVSILHMHFNRLIGIDRQLENNLLGMIRKYVYSINMRRKKYVKKYK